MPHLKLASAAAILVALAVYAPVGAGAQERDPFRFPTDTERLNNDIDAKIERALRQRQAETEENLRRQMQEGLQSLEARLPAEQEDDAGVDGDGAGVSAPAGAMILPVPAGSIFVACMGGKAMFKDASGNAFYSEDPLPTGVYPCVDMDADEGRAKVTRNIMISVPGPATPGARPAKAPRAATAPVRRQQASEPAVPETPEQQVRTLRTSPGNRAPAQQ